MIKLVRLISLMSVLLLSGTQLASSREWDLSNSPSLGNDLPYRWVYVSRKLQKDSDVRDITRIVRTASEHGLNGMVLAAGLDRLDLQRADYFKRLEQVKQVCSRYDIEIIPAIFNAGYGSSVLAYDRNLAAGIAVKDALFVVGGRTARLIEDPAVEIVNGGFEQHVGDRLEGYRFHDKPGQVSFVDKRVYKSGRASLRFENFGKHEHGHARLMQEVKVQPHRCYRVSCSVRTEQLEPSGSLRIMVLSADGRSLAPWNPQVPSTTRWQKVSMGFNSLSYDKVRVYVGVWGGKSGRFWVDDFKIEEVALLNVLRRPGAPITVKDEATGRIYEEGRDFIQIVDYRLKFRFDHGPIPVRLAPGTRIKDGQRLRVSYYHGMAVNKGQVTLCMSEPKLYEIWRKQARLLHRHLAPKKYMLSMDEIRAGGACHACKSRNMSMAQILGDCITRQVDLIRDVNPAAEILIWSDMLDPNHNARGNYFLVDGDFTGSWTYVPKDLVIVCWYYAKRNESLKFFSSLGFRTVAGAYYDGDTLDNPKGWLRSLQQTPKASGIMYTTWRNKYELLAPFGDLVTGRENFK
ncbi:MAG: hypothetical protein JSU70_19705 [Phycisphaerales bacterium]|nr:MAG: hypothetical protein JSU70_19705 [Phycisphaerales bacterium]